MMIIRQVPQAAYAPLVEGAIHHEWSPSEKWERRARGVVIAPPYLLRPGIGWKGGWGTKRVSEALFVGKWLGPKLPTAAGVRAPL